MKELGGRVAVITGGGGGFGREIAMLCAREGMRIVLADIDSAALTATTELLGIDVESLSRRCDVSSAESVEDLAKATYQRFGACHLLFNKAGVGAAGPVWTATLDDWTWTLGVI
jgi:NAD(P)-dependent dehydrogenase (short-subunit alcohol dehydrogenase family)